MQQPLTAASRATAGLCLRPLTDEAGAICIVTICARAALSVEEAYRASRGEGRFAVISDPASYARFLAGSGQDPTLWKVAWDGQEIAGQVLCRIERDRAEVFEVSVRPGWRRRGLARALLAHALNRLHDRGVTVVRLHTREDSPDRAADLYQQLGFRTVKRFPRYRKPL